VILPLQCCSLLKIQIKAVLIAKNVPNQMQLTMIWIQAFVMVTFKKKRRRKKDRST